MITDIAPRSPTAGGRTTLPLVVIACRVLQDLLEQLLPADAASHITFHEYALHRVPPKLTAALQESLDAVETPSLVLMGYGLCGNGLLGLRSGGHTLVIPRTDDCIAVLLGSYHAYMTQQSTVPGTYYLSRGWLDGGSHPLKEFHELQNKYDQETSLWILDQQYANYERLALVGYSDEDLAHCRGEAQEVATFCQRWNWRYEEIHGSDAYVRRLVEVATALAGGATPEEAGAGRDFVILPPGSEVRQEMFRR